MATEQQSSSTATQRTVAPTSQYQEFHHHITKLFKLNKLILDELEKYDLLGSGKRLKSINDIKSWSNLYRSCYNHSKSDKEKEVFVKHFRAVYEKYKDSILKGFDNNIAWLSKGQVKTIFMKREGHPYVALHLSSIFQLSWEMRGKAYKTLEAKNLSKEEFDDECCDCDALYYPDQFIHRLYSIFHCLIHNMDDRSVLKAIISKLEESCGDEDDDDDNGFAGIAKTTFNLIKKSGILPDEYSNNIDEGQVDNVVNAIGGIFNNSNTKNIITNIMSDMKNAKGLDDIVRTVTNNFNSPEMNSVVQEGLKECSSAPALVPPSMIGASVAAKQNATTNSATAQTLPVQSQPVQSQPVQNQPAQGQYQSLPVQSQPNQVTADDDIKIIGDEVPVCAGSN